MYDPTVEAEMPRVRKLTRSALAASWDMDERIDWGLDLRLPRGVPHHTYVDMVSQLYYAEEATLQFLARMTRELPELAARQYIATQMADESRHMLVYSRYLEALGDIAPINNRLHELFEGAISWKGSAVGLVVALNLVMEGEALDQQKRRIDRLPCPLFAQLNRAIIVDEARHAAFGRLYLSEIVPKLSREEVEEINTWIGGLWKGWMTANEGRFTSEQARILAVEEDELNQSWRAHERRFRSVGLLN